MCIWPVCLSVIGSLSNLEVVGRGEKFVVLEGEQSLPDVTLVVQTFQKRSLTRRGHFAIGFHAESLKEVTTVSQSVS